ncbi:hypothetical protein ETD86_31930 [Nonomuraea turkmeniaca]|uniref:Uncharacterized protein n=1 Tax=Nonomuraea turkmeniaca TaxID=103838 RepID=A0A5S4F896_9ACTN|nr:hypothetical protein [Nonomuraea turkmeniaca]TMR12729.1 hypothetical protein ETD86_31930 [Nonomuraea turkmeniaca]
MPLRLTYLAVTSAFAALRFLPMSERDRDVESLALRHQITVFERQLGDEVLRRLRPLVRPDTVGLSAGPRRTRHAGHQGRAVHSPTISLRINL